MLPGVTAGVGVSGSCLCGCGGEEPTLLQLDIMLSPDQSKLLCHSISLIGSVAGCT